jgi:hypothetical protein
MRLRASMTFPDLAGAFREQVAREFTAVVSRERRALEKQFEAATISAGLGQGMAKSWQSATYPSSPSLGAAGLIWSRAPKALRSFAEGATITANGGRFLAIPSAETRRLRTGRNQPAPTPADVERRLGIKLLFIKKGGKRFLVAPSRERGRRRGRLFVAFFLVPRAVIKKRLDLAPMAVAATARIRVGLADAIANAQRALSGAR